MIKIRGLKHVTHLIIKTPLIIYETTVVSGTRALFTSYCCPWRQFCLLLRPAYTFECETPDLNRSNAPFWNLRLFTSSSRLNIFYRIAS